MSATAFAPGSVTTIFAPQGEESSLGISFATADGVTAIVERASQTDIILDGCRAEIEPVSDMLQRLDTTARVRLDADVPIGCGFGVSGAATLATALAVNADQGLGYEREALLETAHRAEVAAGTGLGDVFIQDRGGLVWDVGKGLQHSERTARIGYASFGEMATAEVLGDEAAVARVVRVGEETLAGIEPTGPLASLFDTSWAFADRVDLTTERIVDTVERVQSMGGSATMAMIGETVVATGVEGVLDRETRIAAEGARVR